MTAFLNFESTIVTSINCPTCPQKVYTPKADANLTRVGNYTYVSPFRTGVNFEYEGLEVVDTFCIPTVDDYLCTTDAPDQTDDDFTIIVLNKYLKDYASPPQFGGILGLTPSPKNDYTLGSYYKRMRLSDSNTLTITPKNGGGYRLNYGKVAPTENVTWINFTRSNYTGLWQMPFTEVNISDFTIFSNTTRPVRAIVANTYPYILYETASNATAWAFRDYLTTTYGTNITINNDTQSGTNYSVISGTFIDDCADIKTWYGESFKNLTFDTNKNQQDGRVLHVKFDKLLIELIPGKCEFGLYLVYDPNFMSEKFIFGTKFMTSYQSLSFNYDDHKLGLKGYITNSTKYIPPPKPNPTPENPGDSGNNNG